MNVTGIIAEYNPFHNGHRYQIAELKRTQHPDYIIVAMSGDFLQRGAPALIDKYTRAQMALCSGADLVLELPVRFATASAERFALGGVWLFATTGLTNTLCFGTESADFTRILALARLLTEEPEWYRDSLNAFLKRGLSFPAARAHALPQYEDLLQTPNNILALEYCKALLRLDCAITPVPILRNDKGYHDQGLDQPYASASAIRSALLQEECSGKKQGLSLEACCGKSQSLSQLQSVLPLDSYRLITQFHVSAPFLWEDDFSLLLHHRLLSEDHNSLLQYADLTEPLANRILQKRNDFLSWSSFCRTLKSRDITYTRISRILTHILLQLRAVPLNADPPCPLPYLRVLGFRKSAATLLQKLHAAAKAPIITSLASAERQLDAQGLLLLREDLHAADVYRSVLTARSGKLYANEYTRKLLVV